MRVVSSLCQNVDLQCIVDVPHIFFLRKRRPPRSTLSSSSAASDVYKRQVPRPARNKLLLFADSLQRSYPQDGLIFGDSLMNWETIFDWTGDSLMTNFETLFMQLRSKGFFLETLKGKLTNFNAHDYLSLLIVDPE
eukprot:TRINITY_DN5964_c0_g1_i2.p1 TRINITY_DN5964_c0_g1~~TRINITY_DN5964_c0_g1_i2.p1  ORF type:complete len:136 (+),score=11.78 TRINITY_DN5964_c0_g1_i2:19-426(+)